MSPSSSSPAAASPRSSSISSSDPLTPADPWRRFARRLLLTAATLLAFVYGFVIIIDPWNTLPLSPPLPRAPISANARYTFPALARDPAFDAIIIGDSSARLLRPTELDPLFAAHFANLAMNSATPNEQNRLFDLFLQTHPNPSAIIIAITNPWCSPAPQTYARDFPTWMYGSNRWPAYGKMLSLFAVQEAWNQFATMIGLKPRRYGLDGYTSFVPPETTYDTARRDQAFRRWPALDQDPAPADFHPAYPALTRLAQMLDAIPKTTRIILYFSPYYADQLGSPGSATALRWSGCKQEVAQLARAHHATGLDFQIPSPITTDRDNFWDPVHYRQSIATQIAAALASGTSPNARNLAN